MSWFWEKESEEIKKARAKAKEEARRAFALSVCICKHQAWQHRSLKVHVGLGLHQENEPCGIDGCPCYKFIPEAKP